MGKRHRQQKPRYITIKIQYYPIPTRAIVTPFLVVLFFMFIPLFGLLYKESQVSKYEAGKSFTRILIPGYKSLLAQAATPTDVGENTVPIQEDRQVIFHGSRDRKEIALTFDADMTPGMKSMLEKKEVASYYDSHLIEILNETQTKATFFLSGMWIELYSKETQEFASNPLFELGSHSYSHPSFDGTCFGLRQIADAEDQDEIQRTQFLLRSIAGVTGTLFRFPGGCYGKNDIDEVQRNGLQAIQWDVAGVDGFNNNAKAIEDTVLNHVQNGSIIVLHMNGYPNEPMTAEAVQEIIPKLKEKGFTFVKVSELLAQPQTQQAFNLKQLLSYY